jgi:two-component system, NtrC family, sensor kinase
MNNSGRRILIVDDLPENRELLEAVLIRHDYAAAVAGDGIEALEKLRAGNFDLIITDVLMPKMDGFQLCREVKRDEQLKDIPVIFYTATYVDPKDEELAASVGAAVYIVKPMELLKFLSLIEKIIIEPPPKTAPAPTPALTEDAVFLQQYNQRLIQQLEKKLIELNEARAATRISETKYRTIADFTYNWEYWVSPEGKFIYSSPSFKRISGYENDMLMKDPKNLFDIIHEEDRPAFKKHFEAAIQDTLTIHHLEFRIVRRDGGIRWLFHACQPVYDQEGRFIGRRASNGDITERKRLEESLKAKNEELNVMSQQLWQAVKLATMGELAASIAHELNNPLATVSLRIESLTAQTPEGDKRRRELEIIGKEVERMGNLVANLLQFSRRSQKQISTVDIREEIEKTLELIEYHLRKNNVQVIREFAPDAPCIHADRQQLRQLFLNLFTNAGDAMPKGGTLTIRVAPQPGEKKIFIEIADTGAGIPPEILPKVMEAFYTTKPEGKGTGLGLAICRRVAQEHQGTFDITSEGIPGRGAKARITLSSMDPGNAIGLTET